MNAKDTNFLSFHINHYKVSEGTKNIKQEIKREKETVKRPLLSFVLSDFHWISSFCHPGHSQEPPDRNSSSAYLSGPSIHNYEGRGWSEWGPSWRPRLGKEEALRWAVNYKWLDSVRKVCEFSVSSRVQLYKPCTITLFKFMTYLLSLSLWGLSECPSAWLGQYNIATVQ